MAIPIFEAVFDNDTMGVFGISLVENPATEECFVRLSSDKKAEIKEREMQIRLATANDEQRLLIGLVLEPDQPIYRNDNGEEYSIVFNKETIKQLAFSFIERGYQLNSTIEHNNIPIKEVAFVESWIVADPKKDKSNAFGMEYPEGSWLVTMKVKSDEIWNDYVKTGKVKGFSIDALIKLRNTNKKVNMSLQEKLKKAADNLAKKLGIVPVTFGQIAIQGGDVTFEFDGETPEPGGNVFAIDPADPNNKVPVPVGKYPLEDGSVLVVTTEGKIDSIVPAEGQQTPAPAPKPAEGQPTPAPMADAEKTVNEIKSILIKYEASMSASLAKIEALEKSNNELKTQLEDVKKEVVAFSEAPARKPIAPVQEVNLTAKGRILEMMRKQS